MTPRDDNGAGNWRTESLRPAAVGVSASRRTDIPALYGRWFAERLRAGWAEYRPAGPPRKVRASLAPEDVTHFTFWTRWPRPFLPVLERVLERGFPVLWNVSITGLGGTAVEPKVPSTDRAIEALKQLAAMVSARAIQWRYDPVFLSERYDEGHHLETFERLAGRLAGHVDRVAISFVEPYGRRVVPDMAAYQRETNDRVLTPDTERKVELASRLARIAELQGLRLGVCCDPDPREGSGCPRAGCSSFSWAASVYPELSAHRPRKAAPMRPDCGCSKEIDIGVYDTCTFGCRYSYGSRNARAAQGAFQRHDPMAPCLVP